MGLFSKKTIICPECGTEYTARVKLGSGMCEQCLKELLELEKQIQGYKNYAPGKFSTLTVVKEIIEHRAEILEKYRPVNGISKAELIKLSDDYKNLSDDDAQDILSRAAQSMVNVMMGAGYAGGFFVPTLWDGIVVDAEDVFAVTYTEAKQLEMEHGEVLVCTLFTNDPYVPAFTMVTAGKKGLFDGLLKRKSVRDYSKDLFESLCPNLTYPMMELKAFAKLIAKEDNVKGNISVKQIKAHMDEVKYSYGTSNETKMTSKVTSVTDEILDKYGYITDAEIARILLESGMFKKNFWKKQLKKMEESV